MIYRKVQFSLKNEGLSGNLTVQTWNKLNILEPSDTSPCLRTTVPASPQVTSSGRTSTEKGSSNVVYTELTDTLTGGLVVSVAIFTRKIHSRKTIDIVEKPMLSLVSTKTELRYSWISNFGWFINDFHFTFVSWTLWILRVRNFKSPDSHPMSLKSPG